VRVCAAGLSSPVYILHRVSVCVCVSFVSCYADVTTLVLRIVYLSPCVCVCVRRDRHSPLPPHALLCACARRGTARGVAVNRNGGTSRRDPRWLSLAVAAAAAAVVVRECVLQVPRLHTHVRARGASSIHGAMRGGAVERARRRRWYGLLRGSLLLVPSLSSPSPLALPSMHALPFALSPSNDVA